MVKPRLAQQYGLPLQQPEDVAARNKDLRNGALAKRKKTGLDDFPLPKRQRSELAITLSEHFLILVSDFSGGPGTFAEFDIVEPEVSKPKRAVKYPIEDLHLDPMSIFDGRLLRRTSGDIPDLPRKPPLSRELPVALELFDVFLHTWSTLNIFGLVFLTSMGFNKRLTQIHTAGPSFLQTLHSTTLHLLYNIIRQTSFATL